MSKPHLLTVDRYRTVAVTPGICEGEGTERGGRLRPGAVFEDDDGVSRLYKGGRADRSENRCGVAIGVGRVCQDEGEYTLEASGRLLSTQAMNARAFIESRKAEVLSDDSAGGTIAFDEVARLRPAAEGLYAERPTAGIKIEDAGQADTERLKRGKDGAAN
jgi:hypothetical protein